MLFFNLSCKWEWDYIVQAVHFACCWERSKQKRDQSYAICRSAVRKGKGTGKKVNDLDLIAWLDHFLLFASLSRFNCMAYLYLTLRDKYLHQGGCQVQAQKEGCRQAPLEPQGPQARRVGRRRGYRFHLQGLIGGREGLWALVSFYGSFNVLGLLQAFKRNIYTSYLLLLLLL